MVSNQEFNIQKTLRPTTKTLHGGWKQIFLLMQLGSYLHHHTVQFSGLEFFKVEMFISDRQEHFNTFSTRVFGPPAKDNIESWPTVLKQIRHCSFVLRISSTRVGHQSHVSEYINNNISKWFLLFVHRIKRK